MGIVTEKIDKFQQEVIALLENSKCSTNKLAPEVGEAIKRFISQAKKDDDKLSQLYGCLLEAKLDGLIGDKQTRIDAATSITSTKRKFILVKEEDKSYDQHTRVLTSDLFSIYTMLAHHFSGKENSVIQNSIRTSPIINSFMETICTGFKSSQEFDKPTYELDWKERINKTLSIRPTNNHHVNALLRVFNKHNVKSFSEIKVAFVGGRGEAFTHGVRAFAGQFGEFHNFSPDAGGGKLNMEKAEEIVRNKKSVDYVITSNVLNAYFNYVQTPGVEIASVMASSSRLLKPGGIALHLMPDPAKVRNFQIVLNKEFNDQLGLSDVHTTMRDDKNGVAIQEKRFGANSDHSINGGYEHYQISMIAQQQLGSSVNNANVLKQRSEEFRSYGDKYAFYGRKFVDISNIEVRDYRKKPVGVTELG